MEAGRSGLNVENRLYILKGPADILDIGSFKDFSDIKISLPTRRFCEGDSALMNRHKYLGQRKVYPLDKSLNFSYEFE